MRGMSPDHVEVCHFGRSSVTTATRRALATAMPTATRTVVPSTHYASSSPSDEPGQFTLQIRRAKAGSGSSEQSPGSLFVVVRVPGVRAAPPPQRGLIYTARGVVRIG